jgi:hypothetical protein
MMSDLAWMPLVVQVAMGFSLAACAGFRAFLPLLALGTAARFQLIPLASGFGWLSSNEALVILAAAVVLEFLGDKLPLVDHVLDAAGLVIRPAAGFLVAAAPLLDFDTKWKIVLGLVTGSAVAGAVHLGKAKLRLASTMTTAGFGNPILSVAEDVLGFTGTLLAVFVPLLAAVLALALLFGLGALLFSLLRRSARGVAA